jgi:hypothetical protein
MVTKERSRLSKKVKSVTPKRGKKKTALRIEARPLTEEQIQYFIEFYKERKAFPGSKIPCTVTGKLTTCVGPWLVKKIKEFGSAEALLRNYVCREALKEKRVSLKPVSARKERKQKLDKLKTEDKKEWDIPKMNAIGSRPINNVDVSDITKDTCLMPDLFLDNERFCDGCRYFEDCTNKNKALKPVGKRRK